MIRMKHLRRLVLALIVMSAFSITRAQDEPMLSDLGFRAATDGFSFENYTNESVKDNLTAPDMQRMFGNTVCATQGDNCILIPPAQEWMDKTNEAMNGGHCEGMAALSLLFYGNKEKASEFGGASTAELQLTDNEKLQREIAYFWATQATDPTVPATISDKTPAEVLDILIEAMKPGPDAEELYTVGIYQRGFKGGHAISPYAVQDKGDGLYWIMVYDNNFPKDERHIEVNKDKNTWSYSASTNPNEPESLYEGDAETKTLQLTPSKPRLEKQICTFCTGGGTESSSAQPSTDVVSTLGLNRMFISARVQTAAPTYNQIWLVSNGEANAANLLITTADGKKLGYDGGKFVNTIPGARFIPLASKNLWQDDPEPVYLVPTGIQFTVTLDGSALKTKEGVDVAMIGPGYNLSVEDIQLDPNQTDTITFAPDGSLISYKTSQTEAPNIVVGIQAKGNDYEFEVKGADVEGGGVINIGLDYAGGTLSVDTAETTTPTVYELLVRRITDTAEEEFSADDLELKPEEIAYVDFAKWPGNGQDMTIEIDSGGTKTPQEAKDSK